MTTFTRRGFLKHTLAGSVIAVGAGAGLLGPACTFAADWPKDAFTAQTADDALIALYGTKDVTESNAIKLNAPSYAQNGAIVDITVSTSLPNVDSIAIVVDKNPEPLIARVKFAGAEPFIRTRIKMNRTSEVRCLVRSDNTTYMKRRLVKVLVGCCDD